MAWKAKVIAISEVDSNQYFEVVYQITEDSIVLYDNLKITAKTAKEVKDGVKIKADELRLSLTEVKKLSIGQELDL